MADDLIPEDLQASLAVNYLDKPLGGALLPWRKFAFPLDWSQQFTALGALHLEVGFGDGRFTVRRALDEPGNFVGLEISSASIQRALKNIARHQVGNVRVLKVGADFALRHLFEANSLSSITVNFPDPWPKERHEKNRLLKRSFFDLAASRLLSKGEIRLATDHPDYLAFARSEALASQHFNLIEATPPEAVFETKYALKWKSQGKPLYYQIFQYQGGEAQSYPPLERVMLMPHAMLSGELPDQLSFAKQVVPYAQGHVILHEVANSMGGEGYGQGRWLVRVTVDEPDLRQQLLVSVKHREKGGLLVQLEPFGDPVVTQTVRGAVHAVTEWLLTLPIDLQVTVRSY